MLLLSRRLRGFGVMFAVLEKCHDARPVISEYYRETWFTPDGARLKYLRLRAKGLPCLANWRFVTLTVEDHQSGCEAVYQKGKDRLRRFTQWWRDVLGREVLWCWKLELHEDGYPHWHMLIDYRKRIPREFLNEIEKAWGLGRVNVKRVRYAEMHYVFKYVSKGFGELPDWIMDRLGRTRVFQSSRGFFQSESRPAVRSEKRMSIRPVSLRTQLEWDRRRALLVSWEQGKKRTRKVRLSRDFAEWFFNRLQDAIDGGSPLSSGRSFTINEVQKAQIEYEHRNYCKGLAIIRHGEFAGCCRAHPQGNDRIQADGTEDVGRENPY